jgi:hypothetical protein
MSSIINVMCGRQSTRIADVVLLSHFTGCANLNTIARSMSLPDAGRAIDLDAPQRVAIADKNGKVCAEPSPDALQACASSLSAGFAAPLKDAISVAQALSARAGRIGLRTQAITLMRDALYRICELHRNEAISPETVIQLLQR